MDLSRIFHFYRTSKIMRMIFLLGSFCYVYTQALCNCKFKSYKNGIFEDFHSPCAYLFRCDGHQALYYRENETIELCCQTSCQDCIANQTLLTVIKDVETTQTKIQNNWNSTNDGECSARLTIPSAKKSDSGSYNCFKNGDFIYGQKVYVIGPVQSPKILSVTVTWRQKTTISVQFNSGSFSPLWTDKYRVSMEPSMDRGLPLLCSNETIVCKNKVCLCVYESKVGTFPPTENVTISITKTRAVQSARTSQTFNLMKHIQPGLVTYLKVIKDCPMAVHLQLCFPEYYSMIIPFMKLGKKPLVVSVHMMKTQGFYEEREFNVTFEETVCAQIPLSQLTPFTWYNLSVISLGGGGSGPLSKKSFVSCESVPLSPPKDVYYWIAEEGNESHQGLGSVAPQQRRYDVNVNWKPVSHDDQGGEVWYEVIATDDKGSLSFHALNVTKPYVPIRQISDAYSTVKIYTWNRMGKSQNYSLLVVHGPSLHNDISNLESHVEKENDQARVFIQKPETSVKIVALYGCIGYQDPQSRALVTCKDFPSMISNEPDLKDQSDLMTALITLKTKKCQPESSTNYRHEVCRFGDSFDRFYETQSFTIKVTKFANMKSPCSFDVENESSKTFENLKDENDVLKFMFSVNKNGKPVPQLFPFKCYYNSKYDNVILDFKELVKNGGVTVAWKQFCDSTSPQQFLASNYHVYTSQNKDCLTDGNDLPKDNRINKLLKDSLYHLEEQNVYVCVASEHSFQGGVNKSQISSRYVKEPAVRKVVQPYVIAIIIIIFLLFTIVALFVRLLYKKKERRMKKLPQFSALKFEKNPSNQDISNQEKEPSYDYAYITLESTADKVVMVTKCPSSDSGGESGVHSLTPPSSDEFKYEKDYSSPEENSGSGSSCTGETDQSAEINSTSNRRQDFLSEQQRLQQRQMIRQRLLEEEQRQLPASNSSC